MSSFLADQAKQRRGKWTAEEEMYAASLMEAFKDGSILEDVEDGMSLRGYLALKLRTGVKRISKKYEGTNYEGKRIYLHKPEELLSNDPQEIQAREAKKSELKELELKFEESVKMLQDAEATKKHMTAKLLAAEPSIAVPVSVSVTKPAASARQVLGYASYATATKKHTPASASTAQAQSEVARAIASASPVNLFQVPPPAQAGSADNAATGYISSRVLQDNMKILALQAQANAGSANPASSAVGLQIPMPVLQVNLAQPPVDPTASLRASIALAAGTGQPAFGRSNSSSDLLLALGMLQQQQQQQQQSQSSLYLSALSASPSNTSLTSTGTTTTSAAAPLDLTRTSSTDLAAAMAAVTQGSMAGRPPLALDGVPSSITSLLATAARRPAPSSAFEAPPAAKRTKFY